MLKLNNHNIEKYLQTIANLCTQNKHSPDIVITKLYNGFKKAQKIIYENAHFKLIMRALKLATLFQLTKMLPATNNMKTLEAKHLAALKHAKEICDIKLGGFFRSISAKKILDTIEAGGNLSAIITQLNKYKDIIKNDYEKLTGKNFPVITLIVVDVKPSGFKIPISTARIKEILNNSREIKLPEGFGIKVTKITAESPKQRLSELLQQQQLPELLRQNPAIKSPCLGSEDPLIKLSKLNCRLFQTQPHKSFAKDFLPEHQQEGSLTL